MIKSGRVAPCHVATVIAPLPSVLPSSPFVYSPTDASMLMAVPLRVRPEEEQADSEGAVRASAQ